jgi:hypothetical protein
LTLVLSHRYYQRVLTQGHETQQSLGTTEENANSELEELDDIRKSIISNGLDPYDVLAVSRDASISDIK